MRTRQRPGGVLGGLAIMVGAAASNQVGAAVGAHAFPAVGPAGVVAVRQLVAAAVLLPVARPDLRRFTWAQWWPTLLLGLVFATMNLSVYIAIDRIGLGLAITLEFLGPLSVALAGSRTRLDLFCAVAAGAGVYVLVLPDAGSDWLGIGAGLLGAACWASYILLNRLAGARLPGLQAPAAATTVSVLLYLPVVLVLAAQGRFTGSAVLYAVGAGILASAIPYAADVVALRRVPARFFGIVMSAHPVWAALAGLVLLGEVLRPHEWTGMAIVVAVNVIAAVSAQARSRPPAPVAEPAAAHSARSATDAEPAGATARPATTTRTGITGSAPCTRCSDPAGSHRTAGTARTEPRLSPGDRRRSPGR
jgi:inner membrane transporter RhtA